MGLLVRLRLRRSSKWERPTVLDQLLRSPLFLVASVLYDVILALRGRPVVPPSSSSSSSSSSSTSSRLSSSRLSSSPSPSPSLSPSPSPSPPPIRIVCISDTHDNTPLHVPDGDLLVHAGDTSSRGGVSDVQAQIDWLASLPHRHKVLVAGNHDECLGPGPARCRDAPALRLRGVKYLENSSEVLEFAGGRRLVVWGSPYMEPWVRGAVELGTDVLVTHQPPKHHLDLTLGCPRLLAELWRVRPRVHIFGHVHCAAGRRAAYFDQCQHAYERLMSRPPRGLVLDCLPHAGWLDLGLMVAHGVQEVLWKWLMLGPASGRGTLLVNAGLVLGNTGKIGNRPQVVDM